MPRPKQRTPELRGAVLSVGRELLEREGVAAFTTRSVAREAGTSTAAVYELFGDKGGLVRALFFEGFRLLRERLGALSQSPDPRGDLRDLLALYRAFVRENPVLSEVMFSRPFTDFGPGPAERRASASVREFVVDQVRRCTDAGVLRGDETDIAHVLVALAQGLAAAENARRLGTSRASVDRRWTLAVDSALDGLDAAPRADS
jgi:AcrR family transcriptional regulator